MARTKRTAKKVTRHELEEMARQAALQANAAGSDSDESSSGSSGESSTNLPSTLDFIQFNEQETLDACTWPEDQVPVGNAENPTLNDDGTEFYRILWMDYDAFCDMRGM